jgi:hypothetical protein
MYGAFMPGYAGGCSRRAARGGKKFFADPDHQPPGYAKELDAASRRTWGTAWTCASAKATA